jgi:N-acyl-D-amino-acid deacylase
VILTGGTVIDGTGAPPRQADVVLRDGVIEALAEPRTRTGTDVTGKIVCPGFVDIHTHSDLTLLSNPLAHSKIRQGVTTEVVGNCGLGIVPSDVDTAALRSAVAYLDLDPAVRITWQDTAGYLDAVAAARPSVNVATLVGHVPVRAAVLGFTDRPATAAETDRMCALVADAFAGGAVGLSTGLAYPPLRTADTAELTALGEVAAAHDKIFTWHLRDYGDDLRPAAAEAIRVAETTGCRTQLSHLCAVGRRNWGAVTDVLAMVDESDMDIGVDVYPYLAGNAPLSQLLPAWVTDAGAEKARDRLADSAVRHRIRTEWAGNALSWNEITVSALPGDQAPLGRTIADLGGGDAALDLVAAHGNAVIMTAGGRSADDLTAVLRHPASVVASDGLALDPAGPTGGGVPHPRSYGCFPRFLAGGEVPLAEAVCKATAAPAARIGLTDRGVLAPGKRADVVVLDPDTLADRATFADPHRFPTGVDLVLVGGEVVVADGAHTGARPGAVHRN